MILQRYRAKYFAGKVFDESAVLTDQNIYLSDLCKILFFLTPHRNLSVLYLSRFWLIFVFYSLNDR